jgi:hypothetical protein
MHCADIHCADIHCTNIHCADIHCTHIRFTVMHCSMADDLKGVYVTERDDMTLKVSRLQA